MCSEPGCILSDRPGVLAGRHAAFRIPQLEITTGGKVHGARNEICRDGDCLIQATGTWEAWSGVQVFQGYTARFGQLRERDLQRNSDIDGVEYRGLSLDGTHEREVMTLLGDRISYSHVRKKSGNFFDTIIDSMCWIDGW